MGRIIATLALNQASPVVLDCTFDYDEAMGAFFARDDIDHKVDITPDQSLVVDTETGEIKTIIT